MLTSDLMHDLKIKSRVGMKERRRADRKRKSKGNKITKTKAKQTTITGCVIDEVQRTYNTSASRYRNIAKYLEL